MTAQKQSRINSQVHRMLTVKVKVLTRKRNRIHTLGWELWEDPNEAGVFEHLNSDESFLSVGEAFPHHVVASPPPSEEINPTLAKEMVKAICQDNDSPQDHPHLLLLLPYM